MQGNPTVYLNSPLSSWVKVGSHHIIIFTHHKSSSHVSRSLIHGWCASCDTNQTHQNTNSWKVTGKNIEDNVQHFGKHLTDKNGRASCRKTGPVWIS